jgi:hypothetical protein
LKPEWWGSPLVQEEKYQEKPVKRHQWMKVIIIYKVLYQIEQNYRVLHDHPKECNLRIILLSVTKNV